MVPNIDRVKCIKINNIFCVFNFNFSRMCHVILGLSDLWYLIFSGVFALCLIFKLHKSRMVNNTKKIVKAL